MKLLYPFAKRFIAGHDFDSAKKPIQDLLDEGYEVSIDYMGENSDSLVGCEKAYRQYVEIIDFYKHIKIDISIKPTQLGLKINPYISYTYLLKLAKAAAKYGHTIRLDMEDVEVTTLTINCAISLNKKFGNVGVAIQANLCRTWEDVDHLIDSDASIRLVKGAYKGDTKESGVPLNQAFCSLANYLKIQEANRPAIATHDEEILLKIDDKYYDYEFLYGIRRDLQKRLKNSQHCVRIYIPFGKDWLPYTLRRLTQWKNLKFVIKNIAKEFFKHE